ncbi:MAG: YlxR family protein [Micrococcales bacterium]|nr:YlxR family protein [Micrococcales bacterium]MDG1817607.1 YlxR family protein [Aquiluna sp.]MBT5397727.1 YlxR family protein [Micrococcales bacterium]MBT5431567.1 YlxR family protein [Micrococcales bacterium]MBT5847997.1 YlxR family protein [Micrococcales bacterium]
MDPIRTCVGCRQRDSMQNLLRVVSLEGELQVDQQRKLPGRGAWIHGNCSQLALDRKGLVRALGDSKTESFETWLRNQAENMADKK